MKKTMAIVIAACMLGTVAGAPAFAGDRGWATTGKVLTGFLGLAILSQAIAHSQPYPAPAYAPPPGYYYPPEPVWVPGHYETRIDQRWIPGHWEVERAGRNHRGYDDDDDYGNTTRRYWAPGHYGNTEVRVWVPGHWEG